MHVVIYSHLNVCLMLHMHVCLRHMSISWLLATDYITICNYCKSGNFHVEIIHVVNIQCRFIFVGLLYPRKYFNMNLFQQKHLAITIVHVLLISRMNINL